MMSHGSWKKHQQNVHIYLKSPHVVASGELAGSIVVHGDTTLMHKIKSIRLDFVGLEGIVCVCDAVYTAIAFYTDQTYAFSRQ